MKAYYCFLIALLLATPLAFSGEETIFIPTKIDGPVHDPANHSYWFGPFCECASVLDIDGDGETGTKIRTGPNMPTFAMAPRPTARKPTTTASLQWTSISTGRPMSSAPAGCS